MAESENAAIAWMALDPKGDLVWLADVWVDPPWIGKGIGSLLFSHALERARRLGGTRMEWEAEPNSVGFYEKVGGRYLRDGEPSEWGRTLPVMGIDLGYSALVDGENTLGSFAGYQNEIYLAGLEDVVPELPTDLTRLEAFAQERMPPEAFGYVAGSAGSEATSRAESSRVRAWRIVPRMLRDVSTVDLSTTVLGTRMPAPVLLAPVGVLTIVHPDGESAVARAAASLGVPMVVSTASSTTLEDVGAANGDGPRWYQLYWPKDRELAASFLRAGRRILASLRSSSRSTPHARLAAPRPRPRVPAVPARDRQPELLRRPGLPARPRRSGGGREPHRCDRPVGAGFGNPALTWDDLGFLREHWDGPIALKGIQHPDDARACRARGDGRHRRLEPRRTAGRRCRSPRSRPCRASWTRSATTIEVLFDSGVRTGGDAGQAARARGPRRADRAALRLRPRSRGRGGVRHVLRCLLAELELTMASPGASGRPS